MYTVYVLCDEGGEIRYVGQTTQPLNRRLSHHRSHAKKLDRYKDRWIRQNPNGIYIVEVQQVGNQEDLDVAERYWIQFFREQGCPLTNLEGGGKRNRVPWNKGKPQTPEVRAKLSAAIRGRKRSPEEKLAISAGLKEKRWKDHPRRIKDKVSYKREYQKNWKKANPHYHRDYKRAQREAARKAKEN